MVLFCVVEMLWLPAWLVSLAGSERKDDRRGGGAGAGHQHDRAAAAVTRCWISSGISSSSVAVGVSPRHQLLDSWTSWIAREKREVGAEEQRSEKLSAGGGV